MKIVKALSLPNDLFIITLYSILLGRAPDEQGFQKYMSDLESGKRKLSILADIAQSKEARDKDLVNNLSPEDTKLVELSERIKDLESSKLWKWLKFTPTQLLGHYFDLWELVSSNAACEMHSPHDVTINSRSTFTKQDSESQLIFSVRVTGGLGDAIIIARFIRDLQEYIACNARFDVYFHSPDAAKIFFASIPGFRTVLNCSLFQEFVHNYDFSLLTNQFVTFANEHLEKSRIIRFGPKVLEVFYHVEAFRRDIEKYIVNHPNFDGAFADLAVKSGHKRYTYLHTMTGIPYNGDRLDISLMGDPPCELPKGPYITVHDGWDTKFDFKELVDRPTKSIPLQAWGELIAELKTRLPDVQIVQIGAKTGAQLPGVDLTFKGKLNLSQSIEILGSAIYHIDSESGLVHIAASLGVKSAVFFGPTNLSWFSYEQNMNIPPSYCGNCWWSTGTWMERCPAGYSDALCMDSHIKKIADVVTTISAAINDELCVRQESKSLTQDA